MVLLCGRKLLLLLAVSFSEPKLKSSAIFIIFLNIEEENFKVILGFIEKILFDLEDCSTGE